MKRYPKIILAAAFVAAGAALVPQLVAAQIAQPTVGAIAGAPGSIPFELYRDNRILLAGTVNGTHTPMLLDSGAGVTTLDRDFADRIGLNGGIEIEALGAGGTEKAELFRDVTIEVGNLRLSGTTVAVIQLDQVEKAIGRPIPAILGREVFMNSIVQLDFDNRMLTLAPAAGFSPPAGATEVKLKRDGTLHYLPVTINGDEASAILDLGNGGALSVSKELVDATPGLATLPYAVGMAGGVGGLKETRHVTVPRLGMAGFEFANVPASLGSMADGPYEGRANAGIQLFKPFTLTLDLGNDRMWLRRTGAPVDFPKDRAGLFTLLEGDHLNVLHVASGSPAAAAGLKAGDRITAIDGERVGPNFYASAKGSWTRGKAGTAVKVGRTDGTTVTVTLKDYY